MAFLLLLSFSLLLSAAGAQTLSSNRFLFIVDGSASMKPFEVKARETVFDLVYSGVRGRMTNGDTYGIWIAGEQNDTSFPMQVWKSRYIVEDAAKAATHVKERGFRGRSRLDLAIADAVRVIKNVEDLTVIIISNGETPISGTPFDTELNTKYRELAPGMKKAKVTFNTALVAQDGAFIAWAVNTPEFLIEVPYVTSKPKKPKAEPVVTAPVSSPAPTAAPVETKPAEVVFQKPRSVASPIVITKETVAQERRSYQAMTAAALSNEAPIFVTTNETNPTNQTVSAAAATNPPAPVVSNVTVQVSRSEKPIAVSNSPKTTAVASVTKSEATNVATALAPKTEPPSKPLTAAASTEKATESSFHPMVWAAFGAGLALAGVLAVYFVIRSRRVEPSLISEALAQERLSRQSTSARS